MKLARKKVEGGSELVGVENPPMVKSLFRSNSEKDGVDIKLILVQQSLLFVRRLPRRTKSDNRVSKDEYSITDFN